MQRHVSLCGILWQELEGDASFLQEESCTDSLSTNLSFLHCGTAAFAEIQDQLIVLLRTFPHTINGFTMLPCELLKNLCFVPALGRRCPFLCLGWTHKVLMFMPTQEGWRSRFWAEGHMCDSLVAGDAELMSHLSITDNLLIQAFTRPKAHGSIRDGLYLALPDVRDKCRNVGVWRAGIRIMYACVRFHLVWQKASLWCICSKANKFTNESRCDVVPWCPARCWASAAAVAASSAVPE